MLDDLRVIIRQKEKTLEANLIEVPPLENWSSRFWSKRSKRTRKKKFKGSRGRTALSARDVLLYKDMSDELIKDSIDLIPWLRALHPDEFQEEKKEANLRLSIQAIPLYGEPAYPKSVMSRVSYQVHTKGAQGRRGYVSTSAIIPRLKITHPRHYRRWRKRKKSTANAQIYSAPREEHLEFREFREQTACNVEIRRLRQTANMLSKQQTSWASSNHWRKFLVRFQRLLPDMDETVELEHLNTISELLMVDDVSSNLWAALLWNRERRLGVGLRLTEQDTLETLLESKPYAATLFGNYLFLFLLGITRKYPELRHDQTQSLWEAVKSWHLRQVGFNLRTLPRKQSTPKFDVRAVWSNLCKISSVLTGMPLPAQSAVRYGQLLVAPHEHAYDYWVFLEDEYDKSKLRTGLWIGQNPLNSAIAPRWTESDNREIAEHASSVKPDEVYDLLVSKVDGVEYVWLFAEDEWNLQGELVMIPRKSSAITSIRGIQVRSPTSPSIPETPWGVTKPPDITQRVEHELSEIARLRRHIFGVRCVLGLDSGMYIIIFESDGETLDTRNVSRTSDLLQILRRPLVEGLPLQSSRDLDMYMTWNPYEDIDYGELQLFQPYVERKTPYVHVRVPLPLTSQELLEQPPAKVTAIISHDESECPIIDGSSEAHGSCWRLKSKKGDIRTLVDRPLSDQDISSLLTAREVFLEGVRLALDLQFESDPESREGWVFREGRRIARVMNLRPFMPGVFMHLDSERLRYELTRDGGGVQVDTRSDLTGERVSSGALIPPDGKWEVHRILEDFKNGMESFIETYFGEDESPELRIIDYDSVVDDMREILRKISKERPKRRSR
jgi:hypothetical protein